MKSFFPILTAITVGTTFWLSSCSGCRPVSPSKEIQTKTVSVGQFSRMDVEFANVELTIGPSDGNLTVSAPENIMPFVKIDNKNGELDISLDTEVKKGRNAGIKIIVCTPSLTSIDAGNAAKIKVAGELVTDKLDIDLSTAASLSFGSVVVDDKCDVDCGTASSLRIGTLKAATFYADFSTAASAKIDSLQASYATVECATAASFTASGGLVNSMKIEASTSGSVSVAGVAAQTGYASASTAGRIRCSIADPASIESSTGGSVRNSK